MGALARGTTCGSGDRLQEAGPEEAGRAGGPCGRTLLGPRASCSTHLALALLVSLPGRLLVLVLGRWGSRRVPPLPPLLLGLCHVPAQAQSCPMRSGKGGLPRLHWVQVLGLPANSLASTSRSPVHLAPRVSALFFLGEAATTLRFPLETHTPQPSLFPSPHLQPRTGRSAFLLAFVPYFLLLSPPASPEQRQPPHSPSML